MNKERVQHAKEHKKIDDKENNKLAHKVKEKTRESVVGVSSRKLGYPLPGDICDDAVLDFVRLAVKFNRVTDVVVHMGNYWERDAWNDYINKENVLEVLDYQWLSATSLTFYIRTSYPLKVKEYPAHAGAVNDLCFDLAIYISNTKKWIGYGDQILHSAEGPIHAVKWRTNLIAWANDTGVKVYDSANNQRITFIERPQGSPFPEILFPHLVWQDDSLLVIGWGTSVKIALIRANQNKTTSGPYRHIMSNMNKVDIVASFQTGYYVSGVAPAGDNLVVLAYIPGEEDREKEFSNSVPLRQRESDIA
ncbi:hypothetical protein ACET3Z_005072 [Daucus carota]